MEPTIDAIFREMKAGNQTGAQDILSANLEHGYESGKDDERARIVKIVGSFRGCELPSDGPNPPHDAAVMRQTSEFVVNAIIAHIARPDQPAENAG